MGWKEAGRSPLCPSNLQVQVAKRQQPSHPYVCLWQGEGAGLLSHCCVAL